MTWAPSMIFTVWIHYSQAFEKSSSSWYISLGRESNLRPTKSLPSSIEFHALDNLLLQPVGPLVRWPIGPLVRRSVSPLLRSSVRQVVGQCFSCCLLSINKKKKSKIVSIFHLRFLRKLVLSPVPNEAGFEIQTKVTYDHETHFDVNKTKLGRLVWQELSFEVGTLETQNWKQNFLDISSRFDL